MTKIKPFFKYPVEVAIQLLVWLVVAIVLQMEWRHKFHKAFVYKLHVLLGKQGFFDESLVVWRKHNEMEERP